MLASACPGWVCYAEKTHAEMIPFMSRTKSPQQIMGTLVKSWLASKFGQSPDRLYHVSVMPCYDKKLEASRQDFYSDVYSTRDVDCVITTGELQLLMDEKGWDLSRPVDGEENEAFTPHALPELIQHPGTSSGSYLQTLIDTLSATIESPSLSIRTIRSSDYEEYTLTDTDTGDIIFKGAKCYGFRNLQNVVRKVGRDAGVATGRGAAAGRMQPRSGGPRSRRKVGPDATGNPKSDEVRSYDYVEVMACPGGCLNGGGQLRPPATTSSVDAEGFTRNWADSGATLSSDTLADTGGPSAKWGDKEWVKKVEAVYWDGVLTPPSSPHSSVLPQLPKTTSSPTAVDLLALEVLNDVCKPTDPSTLDKWSHCMDEVAERKRRELFQTSFRAVESEVGLAVQW